MYAQLKQNEYKTVTQGFTGDLELLRDPRETANLHPWPKMMMMIWMLLEGRSNVNACITLTQILITQIFSAFERIPGRTTTLTLTRTSYDDISMLIFRESCCVWVRLSQSKEIVKSLLKCCGGLNLPVFCGCALPTQKTEPFALRGARRRLDESVSRLFLFIENTSYEYNAHRRMYYYLAWKSMQNDESYTFCVKYTESW